jgi:hypothetical protein
MADTTKQPEPVARQRIGPVKGEPVTTSPDLEALTPHQRALRQAVISEFKARKVKKFVERQVEHINANKQVAEAIRFLFDEHDQPPTNVPLEDVVAERRQIEYQLKWFEAIALELQNKLVRIKELEAYALDLLDLDLPEDKRT